ncbi:hypothetical protein EW145_g113 [Phellinidium pouzarii]|uniref:Eukaryotic translation initiation factor 3 subunit M n=1 Tax=Phellinidium pouzarii TaxID=167371 RepID=A0A4V3XE46_9AGAM|nr:hypothetical protein EW145_g113 [Phellinidium pouzarii]
MASTDSISVFTEGTFEEQIRELVEYIARPKSDTDRPAFIEPFAGALKTAEDGNLLEEDEERKRKLILQVLQAVDSLGEGSDKVSRILDAISHNSSSERAYVKYRVLANLFNAIPRISPARLVVCEALIKLTAENNELDILQLFPADVERWLKEWGVSAETKSEFYKNVAEIFSKASRPETAYAFSVSYVRSLSSSAAAESASLQLIAMALRLPTVFNFDSLFKLENIQALSSHSLVGLLRILEKQGLGEFKAWQGNNQSILEEYQLNAKELERKIRLLKLSELGCTKIGQNVSYVEIASALHIEVSEVEKWVIDVIRVGLLSGKLSQTSQTLLVVRASPRGFTVEQWAALESRLLVWKESLSGIQNVLSAARQTGNAIPTGSLITQEQVA